MRNWPIRVRLLRWFERKKWTCCALGYRTGMARVMLGPDTRAIPERQRDAEVPETRAEEVIARVLHDFMRGNILMLTLTGAVVWARCSNPYHAPRARNLR